MRKKKNSKLGFSLIEIVITITILAIIAAVLAPVLLTYTENSRAQKDISAMDEVVNAVQIAMSDADCYDEMLRYSCANNYITYTDSSGIYGQQEVDEEFWAPDGAGKATTITLNPTPGPNNTTIYVLADGLVNDMTYNNGSVADPRIMEGQMIDENQCYFKDAVSEDGMKTGMLYNRLRQSVGDQIVFNSATYRNSSYTIFITFQMRDGVLVANAHGSFNGTNLHEAADASKGSMTEDYTTDEDGKEKPNSKNPNGGKQQAQYSQSDLVGSGSYCPGMITNKEEHGTVQEGGSYTPNAGHYEWVEKEFGEDDWAWTEWVEEWVPGVNAGQDFNEGDVMPEPAIGDKYTYGDYEYRYGMWCYVLDKWYWDDEECIEYTQLEDVWITRGTDTYDGMWGEVEHVPHCFDDYATFEPGWSVRVIDKTKSSYGPILTEIAGKPVNGLSYTYANCKNITDISWVTFPESTQNIGYIFSGCNNLTSIPTSFKIPSFVRVVPAMFDSCTKITTIPKTFSIPITVQDMAYIFQNTGITEIPSTFVIPNKTTNIAYLFAGTKIKEVPTTLKIPTSVTNVEGLFYGCSKLTNLNNFKLVDNVTNVSYLFAETSSLSKLPDDFNLPDGVTKASRLFASSGILSLPECFKIPSKLTDMSYMFYYTKMTSLPSNFTIPSTVTNMDYAFSGSSITAYPESFAIPTNCTSARCMFSSSKLTTLPTNFTIPKQTDFERMFYYCSKLTYLPDGFKIEEGNTTSIPQLFYYSGLVTLPDGFNFPKSINSYASAFYYCTSLTHLPEGFTVQNGVTSTYMMFYECGKLKSLPTGFKLPNTVKSAYGMFDDCTSLSKLNDDFTLSTALTDAGRMFEDCSSLTTLRNVTNFTMPNSLEDVRNMFYDCTSLEALSNNFTIPKNVSNASYMFYNCKNLSDVIRVDIDNFIANNYWIKNGYSSYYSLAFYNTTKDIYLIGSASTEIKNRLKDGRSNIHVDDYHPLELNIINNASDTIKIELPSIVVAGQKIQVSLTDAFAGHKTLASFEVNGATYTGSTYTLTDVENLTFSNPVLLDQKIIESEHDYKTKSSHSEKSIGYAYFEGAKSLDVKITYQFYYYSSLKFKVNDKVVATYSGSSSKYTRALRIAGDRVDISYTEYGTSGSSTWYGYKIEVTPIYDSSDVEFYIDLPDYTVLTATTHPIKNTTAVTLVNTKISVIESFQVNGNTIYGKTYTFKSSDGNSAIISNIKQYEIDYVNNIPEYVYFENKSSQPNGYYDVYTNNYQCINTITINGEVHNVGGTQYYWGGNTPKTSGTISIDAIELFEAEVVNMCEDTVDVSCSNYVSDYLYAGQTIILTPKDSSKCVDSFKLNGELINGGEFAVPSSGGTLTITDVTIRDYIKGEAIEEFYYIEDWGGEGCVYLDTPSSMVVPCDVKFESCGDFDSAWVECMLIDENWTDESYTGLTINGGWCEIRPIRGCRYLYVYGEAYASNYDPDNLPYIKITIIPYS